MSNVKDARPGVKTITLNDGVEREVRFTLNALAELEEKYGSVEKAFEALDSGSIKAARFVLWAGFMEADPSLTEKQVGSLIDVPLMSRIKEGLVAALAEDMPEKSEETPGQSEGASGLPNV